MPPRTPRLPVTPVPVIAPPRMAGEAPPGKHQANSASATAPLGEDMIIIGIILLIIGFVAKIAIIWTIGIIVLVLGLIAVLLGMTSHAIGGRRHYW